MQTHMTGIKNRRSKGKNKKPEIYLLVEFLVLFFIVSLISLINIKWLTILSAVGAIFIFIISSIPRYKKVHNRQIKRHIYNSNRK
jgi:hypothetical protein